MARNRRPTIILVMAIMNMIMGGITLLCGVCGAGANSFVAAMGTKTPGSAANPVQEMTAFLDREVPGWHAIEVGRGLLLILLAILLVVAGIGLLNMQSWARWLCVFYAAGSFLLTLAYAVYQLGFFLPAMQRWEDKIVAKQGAAVGPTNPTAYRFGQYAGAISRDGVCVVYAIVILTVMLLPQVGETFAAPVRRRRQRHLEDEFEDDQYDDEDSWEDDDWDDDPPPRRRRRPDY